MPFIKILLFTDDENIQYNIYEQTGRSNYVKDNQM